MQEMNTFIRDDVLPSWWANAIQRFISTLAFLRLRQVDAVTIEVLAGADEDAAVLAIDGKWRWIEADVQRAHGGGAPGVYDVWATAADNDIDNMPDPGTDNTDYSFALAITATGVEPGAVDLWRKIGDLDWDGAAITQVRQTVGGLAELIVARSGYATPAGYVTTKTFDPNDFTMNELADVLATVIEDVLKPFGMVVA